MFSNYLEFLSKFAYSFTYVNYGETVSIIIKLKYIVVVVLYYHVH